MTTNVRDSMEQVFATDSRWSFDFRKSHSLPWVFVGDDGPFQKMVLGLGAAFMFAGRDAPIDRWKQAVKRADAGDDGMDWSALPMDGLAYSVVKLGTCEVLRERGHSINGRLASFAGSGAPHAMRCWGTNRSAQMAVATAANHDLLTGGAVRYCRLTTGSHNLGEDDSLSALHHHILNRGQAMLMQDESAPVAFEVRRALAMDPRLNVVVTEVKAGQISATAPHDGMDVLATEAERLGMAALMQQLVAERRRGL